MDRGNIPATQAASEQQRPLWQTALIALSVLLVISELAYLLIALAAKAVIDGGATPHDGLAGALSNGFFMYAASENGPPIFMLKTFFGLPGFNSLYYVLFGPLDDTVFMPFVTSGLAALLVGLLALLGQLSLSVGRGTAIKLLLAVPFSVGWVVLYAGAESSIYGNSVWSNIAMHFLEVPVAFIGLFIVSFFVRPSTY